MFYAASRLISSFPNRLHRRIGGLFALNVLTVNRRGGKGNGNATGPAAGTRRTINGQPAEWDGQGWLPVVVFFAIGNLKM